MSDSTEQGTYWAVITAPILEARTISDGAKLFYCEVSRRTNRLGYCWASNKTLAEELSVGERTISRYVSELELAGFITTEQIGVSDRKRRHERRIRLAVPTPFNLAKNGEVNVAKNGELNVAKNGDHYKENNKSNKNTPSSPPQGDAGGTPLTEWKPERFAKFWEFYRTKYCEADRSRAGERGKAAAAWDKLKPSDQTLEAIAKKLEATMLTDMWKRGCYGVPYASSFLNAVRRGEVDLSDLPAPTPPRSVQPAREEDQWIT